MLNNKFDWLGICVDMMIKYIPQEIDTWESNNKFQDICEHFISISTVFSTRIKAKRNISQIMIDDDETIKILAQIMKRLTMQGHGFAKIQHEENKVITISALRKYEAVLGDKKLSMSQKTALRNGIHELKRMLDEAEE